jgi:hypothetical protein
MKEDLFVGAAIEPIADEMDVAGMTRGEPGLPLRFRCRGREYAVAAVLERGKDTGPCRHGSGERYIRKHWFRIRTTDGVEMKLFFERQPRRGSTGKVRWWAHSMVENV